MWLRWRLKPEAYAALKRQCHVNLGLTARIIMPCRSRCVLGAGFLAPDIEGLRPDVAVVRGCELMSAGMEVTVNEGVGREKVLGMPGRFEPLHLSLSSSCRTM